MALRDGHIDSASAAAPQSRQLKTVIIFSLSVALGSTLWSTISQMDNLILSRLLSLADYGYFSLVVVAAGGVGLAAGPIAIPLAPRLVHLHAMGRDDELLALYRRSTQLIVVIATSAAAMLICFPTAVLWAWTGRIDVAQRSAPTLALYAAGNAISAVMTITFYLQFAMGNLRLHVQGLLLMLVILMPTLIWATIAHGMVGAGAAWFGANLLYLGVWVPVIHRRFAPGLHVRWICNDILRIAIPTLLCGVAGREWLHLPAARVPLIAWLGALGVVAMVVSIASAPAVQQMVLKQLQQRRHRPFGSRDHLGRNR